MKRPTVLILIAVISALATIIAAVITIMPAFARQKSTPVTVLPATALEEELSKGNVSLTEISGKEGQVREWLRSDPQYQTMAQTLLTALSGERVVSPIPLDVIISKYRVALGGGPVSTFPSDQYADIERAKTAMFDTWRERHPDLPQKSFDEIVENIK